MEIQPYHNNAMCRPEEEASKQQHIHNGRPRPAVPPRPMKLVAPYFDYRDFSEVPDPNPSVPLTAPGRLPNFPVKMLAILSRPDLSHIISWMPHGRSWRVWKPREFEVKVIPAYFEHSKFSSFIRQANGWGFRRITKGPDRNSYYHELFLRGLPHLTKMMQRPHPSQKPSLNPSTEPQFYKISQDHPLPECKNEKFVEETNTVLAQCNLTQNSHGQMMATPAPQPTARVTNMTVASRPQSHNSQQGYAVAAFHPVADTYDPIPYSRPQPVQQQQAPAPVKGFPSVSSFPDIEAFLRQCSQNAEALRAKVEAERRNEQQLASTQNEPFALSTASAQFARSPSHPPSTVAFETIEPISVAQPAQVVSCTPQPTKCVWTAFTQEEDDAEPTPVTSMMTRSRPSADDLHSLGSIDILSTASADDFALDISNIDFAL